MLFIVSALPMNGGSTFLVRICKELSRQGTRSGVLVLFNNKDDEVVKELNKYADIYWLSEFSYQFLNGLYGTQLGIFLPLRLAYIYTKIRDYQHVHVMGLFALLFFMRLVSSSFFRKKNYQAKLSVGIYHQNEFMYSAPNFYFSKYVEKVFNSLDKKSIIFFNENSVSNYSIFFNSDYRDSSVLPIGIDVGLARACIGSSSSNRIVSIGQLYSFKTYNEHVIKCMPELLKINNQIIYEVYGEGPEMERLMQLTNELGLQKVVLFKGVVKYAEIPSVLQDALVFIGSGTAIIEASSHGIPSVIGIESCKEPVTYGFFSRAEGFSYHEYVANKKTYLFVDVLKDIILNSQLWDKESESCKNKTFDFSIEKTVEGFLAVEKKIDTYNLTYPFFNFKILLSCVYCSFLGFIGVNKEFANRRNQGFVNKC